MVEEKVREPEPKTVGNPLETKPVAPLVEIQQFDPENPDHMRALAVLSNASSVAHDAFPDGDPRNKLPPREYRRAWAKGDSERRLYGGFTPEGKVPLFVYLYPDEMWEELARFPVSREVLSWFAHIPEDAKVKELNFWTLDETPNSEKISTDAVQQTLEKIFSDTPDNPFRGTTHVTFYSGFEELEDHRIAEAAGFEERGSLLYQFEEKPSRVFVATPESLVQAKAKKAAPRIRRL